jgi:hypothetical protein
MESSGAQPFGLHRKKLPKSKLTPELRDIFSEAGYRKVQGISRSVIKNAIA